MILFIIFLFTITFALVPRSEFTPCTKYKIAAINAILRSGSDKYSPAVDVAFMGEKLCIEKESNGFGKVAGGKIFVDMKDVERSSGTKSLEAVDKPKPGNPTATIKDELLEKTDKETKEKTDKETKEKTDNKTKEKTDAKQSCTEYEVMATQLNNRKGPGTSYGILKQYFNGDRVCITDVEGLWAKLDDSTYLAVKYLAKVEDLESMREEPCTDFYTVTASKLNLRRGPGLSFHSTKLVNLGTQVCVVSIENSWAKLSNNLYCHKKHIVKTSPNSAFSMQRSDSTIQSDTTIQFGYQSTPRPTATTSRADEIVYYSQKDPKWSSIPYTVTQNSGQTIKTSGCGPTSTAMVIATLADRSVTPKEMAALALKKGMRSLNSGTYREFYCKAAKEYNLKCTSVKTVNDVLSALKEKKLVIAAMGRGAFASAGGHIVVFHSADKNYIYAHDPNSLKRVKGTHNEVAREGNAFFVISK